MNITLQNNQISEIKINVPIQKQITMQYFSKLQNSKLNDISQIEKYDIIPNIYEGGFKLWECTIDLLQYLGENILVFQLQNQFEFVLDLGCGLGLCGIFAILNRAKNVIFQDFNFDVLQSAVVPNIHLNITETIQKCSIHFISGDWKDFIKKYNQQLIDPIQLNTNNDLIQQCLQQKDLKQYQNFSLILASEVLYNKNNYKNILDIIDSLLQNERGICLIASKFYYFGVGGSVPEFCQEINKNYNQLKYQILKTIDNKIGNKRVILQIQKISNQK